MRTARSLGVILQAGTSTRPWTVGGLVVVGYTHAQPASSAQAGLVFPASCTYIQHHQPPWKLTRSTGLVWAGRRPSKPTTFGAWSGSGRVVVWLAAAAIILRHELRPAPRGTDLADAAYGAANLLLGGRHSLGVMT